MVHQSIFFLLMSMCSVLCLAQDERYYRKLLEGDLKNIQQLEQEIMNSQFNVPGASYHLDLDGNKIEEIIEPQKRDGVDWIEIRTASGNKLFEGKLFAMGAESSIYKIRFAHISKNVRALIIFLDEGITRGRQFESSGRIFIISWEGNHLSKMVLTEGPHFFHEKEAQRDQYWRRDYAVNIYDLDGDGVREITVEFNHIQSIMKYQRDGEWRRL
jgi:hypothetical protein